MRNPAVSFFIKFQAVATSNTSTDLPRSHSTTASIDFAREIHPIDPSAHRAS